MTKQRSAIEAAFTEEKRPLSPTEVHELAQQDVPNLGIATVYRALHDLVEEGVLKTVEIPGQSCRYEIAALGHHHHFHCNECDKVFDLEGCFLKQDLQLPEGFEMTEHDITIKGHCPNCR